MNPEWRWTTQWRDTQAYSLFVDSGCTHEEAMALVGLSVSKPIGKPFPPQEVLDYLKGEEE
jgi:hypothetical protein